MYIFQHPADRPLASGLTGRQPSAVILYRVPYLPTVSFITPGASRPTNTSRSHSLHTSPTILRQPISFLPAWPADALLISNLPSPSNLLPVSLPTPFTSSVLLPPPQPADQTRNVVSRAGAACKAAEVAGEKPAFLFFFFLFFSSFSLFSHLPGLPGAAASPRRLLFSFSFFFSFFVFIFYFFRSSFCFYFFIRDASFFLSLFVLFFFSFSLFFHPFLFLFFIFLLPLFFIFSPVSNLFHTHHFFLFCFSFFYSTHSNLSPVHR